MEAINVNEATNAIINAIEATNATVDQLVQQGNELCDDVDNLRAEDERIVDSLQTLRADVEVNKGTVETNKEAIEANKGTIAAQSVAIQLNKDAIEAQAKDLADLRATVVDLRATVVDLRAIIDAQASEIADLRAIISTIGGTVVAKGVAQTVAQPTDMAALIARIPKPDAVRTRAAQKDAPVVQTDVAPTPVVEANKDAALTTPVTSVAPTKAAPKKTATPRTQATTNAIETRAYARQYMIENGAKVEQLRDPAAIEATVKSDAFAAWLAAR